MTIEIRGDFETRSAVDLRTRGAAVYFECPQFRPLGLSYRIDKGDLHDWEFGEPCPSDLKQAIEAGAYFRGWNVSFERGCLNWLADNCGWPRLAIDRYRCTASEASALGLPRSLDAAGAVLDLDIKKDKEGARLIQFFSVPRRDGLFNEPADHPEEYAKFISYRRQDVLTEEAAAERIIPLSEAEQAVYTLDQKINDRGVRIDRRSAVAAMALADKTKAYLDDQMRKLTEGAVGRCTEVPKLTAWIESRGVPVDALAKADIADLLSIPDLPDEVRTALELRQQAAKTSVSKLKAMMQRSSADGRIRGAFLYHKASTGRWASVGVNLANLTRPRKEYEDANLDTSVMFDAFRQGEPQLIEVMYGPKLGRPLDLISDAIRGFIMSAPGHDLIQADYMSIEGCVIAWTSGETWKLDALNEIIADPTLPDLYRRTAANIMNSTTDIITKKHPFRQSIGKTSELALGFQGSVSAFYSMSRLYGVDLTEIYAPVWANASEEMREKAVRRYEFNHKRNQARARELPQQSWMACWLITQGWRRANSKIADGWAARENAIRDAVREPGVVKTCLNLRYIVSHGYLFCQLPSGRCLAYASPKLRDQVWVEVLCDDGTFATAEVMDREKAEAMALAGKARIKGATSQSISVLGLDKSGRKMKREQLFGGIAGQNDTQAIARDILVNGMFHAEAAGYPIIGHVYDEMFAEVKCGFGSVKEFERIICQKPGWAEGLPLQADGWRGKRFRK